MNQASRDDFIMLYASAALVVAGIVCFVNPLFMPVSLLTTIYVASLCSYLFFLWRITKSLGKRPIAWVILTLIMGPAGVVVSCIIIALSGPKQE